MTPKILVIDDEIEVGNFFEFYLQEEKKYQTVIANSGEQAALAIKNNVFDLALVDLKLPDTTGIELLKMIKKQMPGCEVIIMTGYSTVQTAVEAMKLGALDYIEKPFSELSELDAIIEQALAAGRSGNEIITDAITQSAAQAGIILAPESPLKQILRVAHKIANQNITVLIEGETGTGKEVFARYIHHNSKRASKPFIGVNCGALTETLLESELFGHEKGAFTGAMEQRRGVFEIANGGTLFLDEIGDASPAIQVKLLRVLETREFVRVGGEKPIKVDVRIIAATNTDLAQAVEESKFRKDLFYRLDVISLNLPPLRERPGDIPALIQYFLQRHLAPEQQEQIEISPQAQKQLQAYHWPGNVRELANVVTGMVALSGTDSIDDNFLPAKIKDATSSATQIKNTPSIPLKIDVYNDENDAIEQISELLYQTLIKQQKTQQLQPMIDLMRKIENKIARHMIQQALQLTDNNRSKAAKMLDITPRMLRYYLHERGN